MAASQSIDIAIADAVVAVLEAAAADLPDDAVIERRLLPIYTLADVATMKIAVAPRRQARTPAAKKSTRREHVVQIAPHLIATSVDGKIDEAVLAAFVDVVETIADKMEAAGNASTSFAGASFMELATDPLYDEAALQSPGVMRAVITCTFSRLASL